MTQDVVKLVEGFLSEGTDTLVGRVVDHPLLSRETLKQCIERATAAATEDSR